MILDFSIVGTKVLSMPSERLVNIMASDVIRAFINEGLTSSQKIWRLKGEQYQKVN